MPSYFSLALNLFAQFFSDMRLHTDALSERIPVQTGSRAYGDLDFYKNRNRS